MIPLEIKLLHEKDISGEKMKNFDPEKFTSTKLLGITPQNFVPIYLPIFMSIIMFLVGAAIFWITNNIKVFKIVFGLSGIVFALSGVGQIRLREVPGFPALRGGCAVIFGIYFLLLFLALGIGVIFFE